MNWQDCCLCVGLLSVYPSIFYHIFCEIHRMVDIQKSMMAKQTKITLKETRYSRRKFGSRSGDICQNPRLNIRFWSFDFDVVI
jgi:hypothetical protein